PTTTSSHTSLAGARPCACFSRIVGLRRFLTMRMKVRATGWIVGVSALGCSTAAGVADSDSASTGGVTSPATGEPTAPGSASDPTTSGSGPTSATEGGTTEEAAPTTSSSQSTGVTSDPTSTTGELPTPSCD